MCACLRNRGVCCHVYGPVPTQHCDEYCTEQSAKLVGKQRSIAHSLYPQSSAIYSLTFAEGSVVSSTTTVRNMIWIAVESPRTQSLGLLHKLPQGTADFLAILGIAGWIKSTWQ